MTSPSLIFVTCQGGGGGGGGTDGSGDGDGGGAAGGSDSGSILSLVTPLLGSSSGGVSIFKISHRKKINPYCGKIPRSRNYPTITFIVHSSTSSKLVLSLFKQPLFDFQHKRVDG